MPRGDLVVALGDQREHTGEGRLAAQGRWGPTPKTSPS